MRDAATSLVEANIRGVLADSGLLRADVQKAMGGSSAIYDFLSEKSRVRSITVETLAKFAAATDTPMVLFFVEPGRRREMAKLLGNLGSLSPTGVGQMAEIALALRQSQSD